MSNQEYLTQARKLLTEDYKTKHSDEYNSWLARHQNSWQQPHVIVPFPPFVVSSALAPFKPTVSEPSEQAVVAKALELYNQFNPAPAKITESVAEIIVEQPIVETVVEEIIVEQPIVETVVEEQAIEEPAVELITEEIIIEPLTRADAIYKIFQEAVADNSIAMPTAEATLPSIEVALNTVPQPAEELAKISSTGRILPSVLQRLRDMTFNRSQIEGKNV